MRAVRIAGAGAAHVEKSFLGGLRHAYCTPMLMHRVIVDEKLSCAQQRIKRFAQKRIAIIALPTGRTVPHMLKVLLVAERRALEVGLTRVPPIGNVGAQLARGLDGFVAELGPCIDAQLDRRARPEQLAGGDQQSRQGGHTRDLDVDVAGCVFALFNLKAKGGNRCASWLRMVTWR